jgi:glucan biosynthesis protein C
MAKTTNRTLWIDYLRSFITILVVAHHASLAYTTFAYFDASRYINSTWPVVDHDRWVGMDIFENFNDIFFMSLMFFISGLFVFNGLQKKGSTKFLYERLKRLGIPFLIAVTFIIPLAYLPSFYRVHHHFNLKDFIIDYLVNQYWPVGPPWFIWLLLFFNIIAAVIPAKLYSMIYKAGTRLVQHPTRFLLVAYGIIAIAYIPLSLWVGQYTWTGWGPFDFQLNRIVLYAVFFLFGVSLGSGDWEQHFFTNNKLMRKGWPFWAFLCLVCYAIVEIISFTFPDMVKVGKLNQGLAYFIFDLVFVASCLASSLACIAFFKQKIKSEQNFWNSLAANAYGIYLVHYIFVTWLQWALFQYTIPVILKFFIVFTAALTASWLIINWIRKIALIKKVL